MKRKDTDSRGTQVHVRERMGGGGLRQQLIEELGEREGGSYS